MPKSRKNIVQCVNLQLAALDHPTFKVKPENLDKFLDTRFRELTCCLIKNLKEVAFDAPIINDQIAL